MFSHWLPAVNNHGGFGRWAFLVVKDIYDAKQQLDDFIASQHGAASRMTGRRAVKTLEAMRANPSDWKIAVSKPSPRLRHQSSASGR